MFVTKLRSNYQLLYLISGRIFTNIGDSIYVIATMWLVHDITGSTFFTGVTGFMIRAPKAFRFLFGPLIDRWPLKRTIVGTELVQATILAVILVFLLTDFFSIWLLLITVFIMNLVAQFGYPAHKKAIPRIVKEENIVSANSALSASLRGLNVVFNAVSGILVGFIGIVGLFVIDFATFLFAFGTFSLLVIPDSVSESEESNRQNTNNRLSEYFERLRAGFDYITGSRLIAILSAAAISNFTYGLMYAVLPSFADSLGGVEGIIGGAGAYGVLMAAMSAGTLVGTIGSSFVEHISFGRLMIINYMVGSFTWSLGILIPGILPTVILFTLTFTVIGISNILLVSVVQSVVEDKMLSRVSAIASSASTVLLPVGSLVGGAAATFLGTTPTLLSMSIGMLFISIIFIVRPALRSLSPIEDISASELGIN